MTMLNGQLTRGALLVQNYVSSHLKNRRSNTHQECKLNGAAYDPTWRTISFRTDEIRTAKELGQVTMDLPDHAHRPMASLRRAHQTDLAVLHVKVRTSDSTICIYGWYDQQHAYHKL
jgi:hypothetical protein